MMISKEISASPNSAQWQSINWKAVESHVLKLQNTWLTENQRSNAVTLGMNLLSLLYKLLGANWCFREGLSLVR
jgi:hypothetical protein